MTDKAKKNALMECQNAYNIVVYQFYFKLGSYQDVLDLERITPRAQASCSSTFGTPPLPHNPLVEANREERILIATALVSTGFRSNNLISEHDIRSNKHDFHVSTATSIQLIRFGVKIYFRQIIRCCPAPNIDSAIRYRNSCFA